jgi:hypothetical protein
MALSVVIYYSQSIVFVNPTHLDYVCHLNKSLYGLKQTPQVRYNRFCTYLQTLGFTKTKSDTSLFFFHRGSETVYLLLYVDDIVLSFEQCSSKNHPSSSTRVRHGPWPASPLPARHCGAATRGLVLAQAHLSQGHHRSCWHDRLQAVHHSF